MEDDQGAVCVTGGNGYVGSWLIMRLLQRGYSVRATIRSNPERDLSFLTSLPGASTRLQIFNADLNEPTSFSSAIEGCVGVFHVAHPMDVVVGGGGDELEETVTKLAMEGALGIVKACVASNTVKKLIYTSSAVTVLLNGHEGLEMVDEETWSDVEICRRSSIDGTVSSSYLVSKTVTERTVLEFGEKKEKGMELEVVSLVLPLVVGPFICPNIPSSVHIALSVILGEERQYKLLTNSYMVHIDDATRALIFVFENANAKGRFICSSHQISFHHLLQKLSQRYPHYHIPIPPNLRETKDDNDRRFPSLSSRKLLNSGFQFMYGLNDIYDGAIQSCIEKGFL